MIVLQTAFAYNQYMCCKLACLCTATHVTIPCVLQPPDAEQMGGRQLYGSMHAGSLPPGFLDDLAARFQEEGLDELIKPTGAM